MHLFQLSETKHAAPRLICNLYFIFSNVFGIIYNFDQNKSSERKVQSAKVSIIIVLGSRLLVQVIFDLNGRLFLFSFLLGLTCLHFSKAHDEVLHPKAKVRVKVDFFGQRKHRLLAAILLSFESHFFDNFFLHA